MSKNSHSFSQKDTMVFCRVGGNVWICRDVFRGYNGALSGRGVFVITDRRATLRSPYAIHSCAVGAFATGGSSQRARDSGAEWNFAVLAARNTKENQFVFPNGEKLDSNNGALSGRGVFVITDRRATLRSPYAIHSCAVGAFATGGSSQRARDSGAEWNFAVLAARNTKENQFVFPNGEKLASAGQAQRSPVYPEKKFSTLKECNWKEVA